MNRRNFLALAAATAAARARAAAPALTFGFSLYGMKSLGTEAAMKQVAEVGFDTVEWCLLPGYDAEPKNLTRGRRKSLAAMKPRVAALMENLSLADAKQEPNHERLQRAFEVANDLAPVPPVETVLGGGEWDKVKTACRDRLGEWAKRAADARVVLAVKPHRFGAVNRPEHAVWLLEQVDSPWLKLVYDWSHFAHRELSMAETIKQLAGRSAFVHIKDTVIVGGKAEFRLPGDAGNTDYPLMLKLLGEAGYAGDVCCEVSGMVSSKKDYDAVEAARRCYDNVAPAFGRPKK